VDHAAENSRPSAAGEFARFASRRICLTSSGGEFKIYDLRANSPLNGPFSKFSGGRPRRQLC